MVHTFALKTLPNSVSPRTPNDMVYGETGSYPLYICAYVSCVKCWLRLTRMDETRFLWKAYSMLLLLHENGKFCWASQVRKTLYEHGFGIAWNQQGVQSPNVFLNVFKQRLLDCMVKTGMPISTGVSDLIRTKISSRPSSLNRIFQS